MKVHFRRGRYFIDIMIESLFRESTVSWVRVVNGINKYVTEMSEEILVESIERVRIAKGKPRQKPAVTLSPISIPIREKMDRHQSRT